MTPYQSAHQCWCRVAIADKNLPKHKKGLALALWFFETGGRKKRPWRTREIARHVLIPMKQCHEAMLAARDAGLVALTTEGWLWV